MPPVSTPRRAAYRCAVGAFVRWVALFGVPFGVAACERPSPPDPNLVRGTLNVQIAGLPNGTPADVRISGPNGFGRTLTASELLGELTPGRYRLRTSDVRATGATWSGTPSIIDADIRAGDTTAVAIRFDITTGALAVTVIGLPSGVSGAVRITGPGGISRVATGTIVLGDLPPGLYSVVADSVNAGGTAWRSATVGEVGIIASTVPSTLRVSYENVMGPLLLGATGLPPGVRGVSRVTGPLQVDRLVFSGEPVTVPVGVYSITPLAVSATAVGDQRSWSPASRPLSRTVTTASRDTLTVAYRLNATAPNVTIDNVVITQAVQRPDNGIPLVMGRDAFLRVFVRADRAGIPAPPARVRLFDGNALLGTLPLSPPVGALPLEALEGELTASYSTRLATDLVRSTLRIVVDVDPDSTLGETERADNVWPAGGTPRALNTTSVPPFLVRFVPVTVGAMSGLVSEQTQARYLQTARTLWPLAQITSDVRAPFVSSAPALQANDANGAWATVLSELRALRVLDGAPSGTHYYGVVSVPYDSGTFGLGLVGSPTAVGWDRADADIVAAHEWGHNFGRLHAPCGDPPDIDPQFPTPGGFTNSIGWDARTTTLYGPTTPDIMGYCAQPWVSEYSYMRVLSFRQSAALSFGRVAGHDTEAVRQDGLLVWGRVVRGRLILEPPRRVRAAITAPTSYASHIVELLDARNAVLGSLSIAAEAVDHGSRGDQVFAVVLPYSDIVAAQLVQLRLRDVRSPLVSVTRRAMGVR